MISFRQNIELEINLVGNKEVIVEILPNLLSMLVDYRIHKDFLKEIKMSGISDFPLNSDFSFHFLSSFVARYVE